MHTSLCINILQRASKSESYQLHTYWHAASGAVCGGGGGGYLPCSEGTTMNIRRYIGSCSKRRQMQRHQHEAEMGRTTYMWTYVQSCALQDISMDYIYIVILTCWGLTDNTIKNYTIKFTHSLGQHSQTRPPISFVVKIPISSTLL